MNLQEFVLAEARLLSILQNHWNVLSNRISMLHNSSYVGFLISFRALRHFFCSDRKLKAYSFTVSSQHLSSWGVIDNIGLWKNKKFFTEYNEKLSKHLRSSFQCAYIALSVCIG